MNRAPTAPKTADPVTALRLEIARQLDSAPLFIRQQLGGVLSMVDAFVAHIDGRVRALEGRIKPEVVTQLLAEVPASQRRPPGNICIDGKKCTRGCVPDYCELEECSDG